MHKKDDLREMHDYENRRKANLKIADDTIQIVRQLREEVKGCVEKQSAIEERVSGPNLNNLTPQDWKSRFIFLQLKSMADESNRKFEMLMSALGQQNLMNLGGSQPIALRGGLTSSNPFQYSGGNTAAMVDNAAVARQTVDSGSRTNRHSGASSKSRSASPGPPREF